MTGDSSNRYRREDGRSIQAMFDALAPRYRRTNRVISFGMDESWRRRLIAGLPADTRLVLDLCTGTGELIRTLQATRPEVQCVGLDFSACMLEQARKDCDGETFFVRGDVHRLPFDESFDAVILAFSLRNFQDLTAFFREVFRVLKPGRSFYFLELTKPLNPLLRPLYLLHLKCVMPWMGGLVSGNREAYRYLARSIQNFHETPELCRIIASAGFKNIASYPVLGGVGSILSGCKAT